MTHLKEPGGGSRLATLIFSSVLVVLAVACDGAERDASGQVIEAGDVDAIELRVGDCFNDEAAFDGTSYEFTSLPVVPCSEPHDNEIYASVQFPAASDAPYPGEAAIFEFGDDACYAAFRPFVGAPYEASVLAFDYICPTADSWERFEDRELLCLLFDLELRPLTGSMRDSAQ